MSNVVKPQHLVPTILNDYTVFSNKIPAPTFVSGYSSCFGHWWGCCCSCARCGVWDCCASTPSLWGWLTCTARPGARWSHCLYVVLSYNVFLMSLCLYVELSSLFLFYVHFFVVIKIKNINDSVIQWKVKENLNTIPFFFKWFGPVVYKPLLTRGAWVYRRGDLLLYNGHISTKTIVISHVHYHILLDIQHNYYSQPLIHCRPCLLSP